MSPDTTGWKGAKSEGQSTQDTLIPAPRVRTGCEELQKDSMAPSDRAMRGCTRGKQPSTHAWSGGPELATASQEGEPRAVLASSVKMPAKYLAAVVKAN